MPHPLSRPASDFLSLPSWRMIQSIYGLYGVEVFWELELPEDGCVYSNKKVALGSEDPRIPGLGLHDLAHFLVSPVERRLLPNYGLGPFPVFFESKAPPRVPGLTFFDSEVEEGMASILNALAAGHWLGEAQAGVAQENLSFSWGHAETQEGVRELIRRGLARTWDGKLEFVPPSPISFT